MVERDLIKQWNTMRSQIIMSQMAPALVLIATFVLAIYGKFEGAPTAAAYLTVVVVAVTGILATISQYAAVREGEALLADLRKIEKPSLLAQKIADSRGLLSLSAIAIIGTGLLTMASVLWATVGN